MTILYDCAHTREGFVGAMGRLASNSQAVAGLLVFVRFLVSHLRLTGHNFV